MSCVWFASLLLHTSVSFHLNFHLNVDIFVTDIHTCFSCCFPTAPPSYNQQLIVGSIT